MKVKNTKMMEVEEEIELIRKENEKADRLKREQAYKRWEVRRKRLKK